MGLGTMPTVECWWTRMLGRDAEAGVVAWGGGGQDEDWEEWGKLRLAQEILLSHLEDQRLLRLDQLPLI